MSDSRILMMGASGSGKTCYMLGMFAEMSFHINNFTLIAASQNDGVRLRNAWRNLEERTGKDRWPTGNQGIGIRYGFKLCYDLNPFHSFDWLDYRGGALNLPATDEAQAQYREFFMCSSCIFVCVSGEYLKGEDSKRRILSKAHIDVMMQDLAYLKEARKVDVQNPFPVVVILTQYDKCRNRGGDVLSEELKELFPLLFRPNSGWHVAICPVSLGFELAKDPENGALEPINVHLPVIFAIYSAMRASLQRLRSEKANLSSEKIREESRWAVSRFLFGDRCAEIDRQISETQTEMIERSRNMLLLAGELANIDIFLSGTPEDLTSAMNSMRASAGIH